jgi:hypothetical protein
MTGTELFEILRAAVEGDILRALDLAEGRDGITILERRRLTVLAGLDPNRNKKPEPEASPKTYEEGYDRGYEDALDEARWAVDGLSVPVRNKELAS